MEKKQEYRNRYKTVRNGMSRHDVDSKSAQICRNILDSDMYREAHYLYAYYPLQNEVDVRLVAQTAWQEGKRVAFPKVLGDAMRFFEVKDFGQLTEGTFGVMEPVENAGAVPVDWMKDNVLVLVPGVAFDRQGSRMGYGKGYYDRYFDPFTESQKRGPSIGGSRCFTLLGVSYACQIADRLPTQSHDLTVPYLVTEEGIVFCKTKGADKKERVMKQYKYILWDLDGTVVDTFEGVSKSLKLVFDHFGLDIDESEYYNFIGPPLRISFPERAGIPEECVEEALVLFRERYNTIGVFECSLFPGVRETMEALHDAGYIQVISSSKMEERCGDIMRKFDLTGFVDEIVGASEDGRIDSKIEVLTETFRRLARDYPDFAAEDAVLIGDTKYDAAGAREAGIDCVGISYGFGSREDLLAHGAIAVFEDLSSLAEELFLK